MRPEIVELCIRYTIDEWRKLQPRKLQDKPPIPPPWGVWIRLYDPLSPTASDITNKHVLRRVWFLTERGLQERDPWEYARFVTVTWHRPWASAGFAPREAIWGILFEIGLAAFAEFSGTEEVYRETRWGSRWGQGYRMKPDKNHTLQIVETLWLE